MTSQPNRVMTNHSLRQMEALAEQGLSRAEIARKTGWSWDTVNNHVGHLARPVPNGQRHRRPDVPRYRRMLKAVAAAEYGDHDSIARRFGLKSALVLKVVLVTARRRVAEADRMSQRGV